jgi:protein involved in polysaccharide export with SLBB domain
MLLEGDCMQSYLYNFVITAVLLALITVSSVPVFAAAAPADTVAKPTSPGMTLTPESIATKGLPGKQGGRTLPAAEAPAQKPAPEGTEAVKPETATESAVTVKEKQEVSEVERAMMESPSGLDKNLSQEFKVDGLRQFGYSFFKPDARGFSPLIDVPVGPEYLLGAGDSIVLSIWGGFDGNYELEVNRSGEIVLPKVGAVKVSGVPFGKLHSLLSGHLAKIFKDFHISLTMGKLRLIKVYLVGEVYSPGDYSISSLSTLINALAAAGGPTKNGTLRAVALKRDGKTVATVDLYDFFARGDKSVDVRLQAGDTIYVPTIGPVAGITGNVRRPGIYELKDDRTLKELIELAGGVTAAGYLQRLQIARVELHDKKVVTDINIDPKISGKTFEETAGTLPLQDMDLVKIFQIDGKLRNYVRVEGHVLRPGDYALKPNMRLAGLLAEATILPEYYSESGQITRITPPYSEYEIINFNLDRALAGDPAENRELHEFDRVKVFSRTEMEETPKVRIAGDVQKPGEYHLLKNMTVRDLVVQAGNPNRTAFMKSAEITRIGQGGDAVSTSSININLGEALKGNAKDNLELQPFDMVMVRRIPNWAEITESYITLKGEFVFPGKYPLYKGEKLSDVIRRAGGFTDKAYLPSAKFTRQYLKDLQQQRSDEILAREESNISKKQGELSAVAASKEELEATKSALEGLQKTVALLKTKRAEGRMVIKLLPEEQLKNSEYNFELIGGDTLEVGIDPRVVSVFGQVYNSTSFLHVKGESVDDYIYKAGGFTRDAEEADTYIIKADGSVNSRQSASFFSSFMSRDLDSGDTLVVPQKIEKIAWIREFKDIATILGQLAIAAGVIIATGL